VCARPRPLFCYLRPSPHPPRPSLPWRMSAQVALSARSSPLLIVAFLLYSLSFWAFAQLSNRRLSLSLVVRAALATTGDVSDRTAALPPCPRALADNRKLQAAPKDASASSISFKFLLAAPPGPSCKPKLCPATKPFSPPSSPRPGLPDFPVAHRLPPIPLKPRLGPRPP